ncbi:MAG: type II toxin-antitoxin system Phd/YefM family antitoxin [Candidatus Schekmanbacteria bacterium]|nr:type II toxin-antitoxin system Phd/YefM family antitoxin [Candidatus Schekmanbacteria bacterium]
MRDIPISEFKAKCIALIRETQKTGEALTITHRGRPVARIEPVGTPARPRRLGELRELGVIHGDIVHMDSTEEWEMER